MTISLCMIVRNEEEVLARCLDSVEGLFDEVIIVDTGSTDRTREIASEYTSKVEAFVWIDDFGAARNYAFSKATMDYCMWLDADDVIEEKEKERLLRLKETLLPDTDIVMMKYNTSFDESGIPVFSYYRERVIKNSGEYQWVGAVHEVIPLSGTIMYSDIAVSHKKLKAGDPDRNLRIYEKQIKEHIEMDPRQQYYYGRELYYHKQYGKAASVFETFMKLPGAWVENKIEACALCAVCYKNLKEENKGLKMLLQSLEFDLPRAELCCDIGTYFFERNNYKVAAYWYGVAERTEKNDQSGGFILPDCYDYIPYLQLCVCYDKMDNIEMAKEYNEKAGKCKPDSKAYLFNKKYFEMLDGKAAT